MTIIYFIVALGVLVFVHEFGHFIVAKRQGIGVEKFSLGFGPKLFSFTRGETTYLISALPFGGYVKLHGEDPAEADRTDPKSYSGRPISHRVPVVFAGPLMNLVLALLLMPVVFMIGRMEPVYLDQRPVVIGVRAESVAAAAGMKKGDEIVSIAGQPTTVWKEFLDFILLHGGDEVELKFRRGGTLFTKKVTIEESPETHVGTLGVEPGYFIGNEAVIDEVSPDSPAAAAGIRSGDQVLRIDGVLVETWTEMSEKIESSGGKKVALSIKRGGQILTLFVVPRYEESMKKWLMGVRKDATKQGEAFARKRYSFGQAIVRGTEENLKLTGLTFSVLGRLVTLKLSVKTLGGPIRIAQASAMAARSGLSDFFYFLAFLSLQLGVLNLLPIPVLDGGHLLFFGIEGVRRRPLSMKVRQSMEQVGFVLLITLMLVVTLNDVESVWGFRQILEKVRGLFH